ncbi:hypothetical protein ACHWQZ_G010281 [Mnemiopsis leidyi]
MPISGVLSNRISHHHMIYLIKELTVDNSGQTCANVKKKVTTHYNYSNSNLDKLCEEIEKDIDRMHSECDTFESFLEFFQEKIDTTCKLLTPRTSKRNSIVNPWITEGLINSIEKKARLYFDWRKTCSLTLPDGNDSLHVKYKEFSKVLKNLIKVAKTVYYSNKFEKYNKNSKKTWEIINELRGKTKMLVKDDFIIDGQRIANRRIIANKFNEYFTSLASNLNEQILSNDYVTIDPINSFVQYLSTSVSSSIFLEDTTPLEIVEIITNLKNGKASDIPIIVLKRPAKLLSTILAQLYNNCMQSGIFPSIFKHRVKTLTNSSSETLDIMASTHFKEGTEEYVHTTTTALNITNDLLNKIYSEDRLDKAIKSFEPYKAAGPDNLQPTIIQNAWSHISSLTRAIMKKSHETQHIPKPWRNSRGIFIPKPGKADYNQPKSYRTITLSPVMLKLQEKVILWHMQNDLKIAQDTNKRQFGFKRGCSTEAALHKVTHMIERGIAKKEYVLGVFLDI